MKLGIMGSESYLMGGNRFFLVFWKITSYSVWSVMYALTFACVRVKVFLLKLHSRKPNLKGPKGFQPGRMGMFGSLIKNGSSVPGQYGKTVCLLPQVIKCTPLSNALDTVR